MAWHVMETEDLGLESRHRSFIEFWAGWHLQSNHQYDFPKKLNQPMVPTEKCQVFVLPVVRALDSAKIKP